MSLSLLHFSLSLFPFSSLWLSHTHTHTHIHIPFLSPSIPLHSSLARPDIPLSEFSPYRRFPHPVVRPFARSLPPSLSHPGVHKNENGSYSAPNGQVDLCRKRQKFSFFRHKLYACPPATRRVFKRYIPRYLIRGGGGKDNAAFATNARTQKVVS